MGALPVIDDDGLLLLIAVHHACATGEISDLDIGWRLYLKVVGLAASDMGGVEVDVTRREAGGGNGGESEPSGSPRIAIAVFVEIEIHRPGHPSTRQ